MWFTGWLGKLSYVNYSIVRMLQFNCINNDFIKTLESLSNTIEELKEL